jgi:NCAIR mutase (PurE)-related protein
MKPGRSQAEEVVMDLTREERIGLAEAVFAAGKSVAQLTWILDEAAADGRPLFVTRLSNEKWAALPEVHRMRLDYCEVSQTAVLGTLPPPMTDDVIAIACAGTSDVPVAREAQRTLRFHGHASAFYADIGIAGLWRLTSRLDELRSHPVIIVVAGMDAALPTALGGLVGSALIAVPTSVGYGVATGGRVALDAILASCSPGVAVVNIDNGYGAACAAVRIVNALRVLQSHPATSIASDVVPAAA